MSFDSWDPFQRLEEFRQNSSRMLDELLGNLSGSGGNSESGGNQEAITFQPEVDLVESSSEFRLYLSIPGMVEDDIMIEIDGRSLTIRGERRPPYDTERRNPQLTEWRYGFFVRQFELSTPVAVDRVRAAYEAGVLTIVAEKILDDPDESTNPTNDGPRPLRDDEGAR